MAITTTKVTSGISCSPIEVRKPTGPDWHVDPLSFISCCAVPLRQGLSWW